MYRNKSRDAGCQALLEDMTYEAELLDLLCEDGFLTPAELADGSEAEKQVALIRRVIRRGFLMIADIAEDICRAGMLLVKRLNSLRVWMDLVDEDVRLRAPPVQG